MIFKEIYLFPDLVEYPDDITIPFRDQTRSICVYLERVIKPLKFKADFKRICFVGKKNPEEKIFINSCNILSIDIPFNEHEYNRLNKKELNHYFTELLRLGINKCAKQVDIPKAELLNGLVEFENGNYVNKWQFKRRSFRELGVKCLLECELTLQNFHLTLVIEKKGKILWQKEILTTVPDEICYYHSFKDIVFENKKIIVVDRSDRPIYEISVEDINCS